MQYRLIVTYIHVSFCVVWELEEFNKLTSSKQDKPARLLSAAPSAAPPPEDTTSSSIYYSNITQEPRKKILQETRTGNRTAETISQSIHISENRIDSSKNDICSTDNSTRSILKLQPIVGSSKTKNDAPGRLMTYNFINSSFIPRGSLSKNPFSQSHAILPETLDLVAVICFSTMNREFEKTITSSDLSTRIQLLTQNINVTFK